MILIDPELVRVQPLDATEPVDPLDGHPYRKSARGAQVELLAQVDIYIAEPRDGVPPGEDLRAGTIVFDTVLCAANSYTPRRGDLVTRITPGEGGVDDTPYYVGDLTRVGITGSGSGWTANLETRAPQRRGSA